MGSLDLSGRAQPQILFIDAFDSFTNNIVCLLSQALGVAVTVVQIDERSDDFEKALKSYDAVVVGPGPGHPANPHDVGFIERLWKLSEEDMIPVLGICLGFQSLCYSQGADVKKLTRARHGIVSKVSHEGNDIFEGVKHLEATQYHSLKVDVGAQGNSQVSYQASEACPTLLPLAWDVNDEINGPILMGVRHTSKPFWGVQFHPESICTSPAGQELIKNWWKEADQWSGERGRTKSVAGSTWPMRPPTQSGEEEKDVSQQQRDRSNNHETTQSLAEQLRSLSPQDNVSISWQRLETTGVTPTALVEVMGETGQEIVLLDSQGHRSGQYSILGLVVPGKTMKVTYRVAEKTLRFGYSEGDTASVKVDSISDVWPILQETLDSHEPHIAKTTATNHHAGAETNANNESPEDSPFWGGFMGYISYEAGLETIDVEPHASCASGGVPDINFAFIHRSVVFDHEKSAIYVQSLLSGDDAWMGETKRLVEKLRAQMMPAKEWRAEENGKRQKTMGLGSRVRANLEESATLSDTLLNADIRRPGEVEYRNKVLQCQDSLASGDSYELCLTDETTIHIPCDDTGKGVNEWALYKRLRQNNPAPHGAYLNLSGVTVVGSSPERFLRWTREGRCQFRPIKGTVKKGPDVTKEQAHAILGSSKERAENLMIVDLIRHDLSGVVGPESTWVPKLMVVEEYETVYQLVSVIEGQLPEKGPGQPRGLDVLKRSLPPGSMTGAPKKRSCEILRDIEQRPRGVYSGVLGYMDVGGAGDFSVVIRTAMRNTNESNMSPNRDENGNGHNGKKDTTDDHEIWRVGAGGAVTIQSSDEGEFQEMEAKQSSVLGSLLRQKK